MALSVRHLADDDLRPLLRHNLREAYAASGIGLSSLADECGLAKSHLSDVMEGRGRLDAIDLLRVMVALKIDLDDLMRPTTEMLNRRTPFIIHRDADSLGKLAGFVGADQMNRKP